MPEIIDWILLAVAATVGLLDGITTRIGIARSNVAEISPPVAFLHRRTSPVLFVLIMSLIPITLGIVGLLALGTAGIVIPLLISGSAVANNLYVLWRTST